MQRLSRFLSTMLRVAFCYGVLLASSPVALAQKSDLKTERGRQLQTLSNDLALQLKIAFRKDAPEHLRRYRQLVRVLQDWNKSARSEHDYQAVLEWVQVAIKNSMPGSNEPLPALPHFYSLEQYHAIKQRQARQHPKRKQQPAIQRSVVISKQDTPNSKTFAQLNKAKPNQHHRDLWKQHPASKTPVVKPKSNLWVGHPASKTPVIQTPMLNAASVQASPSDPFKNDPIAELASNSRRPTNLKPLVRETRSFGTKKNGRSDEANININHLVTRITGFSVNLRQVESRLATSKALTSAQLSQIARSAEHLVSTHEFIELYVKTMSSEEQAQLPALVEVQPMLEILKKRIQERRELVTAGIQGYLRSELAEEKRTLNKIEKKYRDLFSTDSF